MEKICQQFRMFIMSNKEREELIKLGTKIRFCRTLKKMSQEELSEISGLDIKSISLIENGHNNMKYLTLYKLAQAFGIEVSDLTNYKL